MSTAVAGTRPGTTGGPGGLAGLAGEARHLVGDRAARPWALGLVATSVLGAVLAVVQANGRPILGLEWALLILLGVWALVWLVALACVAKLPAGRLVTVAVIAAGVAIRVASLAGPPTLSDDLYRYSWDAQAQIHGIDPYRYPPGSPALRPLRGPWLWPDDRTCTHLERQHGCTRINRPAVRTIYPPVAEAWYVAAYSVGGGMGAQHKLWQGAGLLTEVAVLALLARLLARTGRDPRWLALYALCPLPAVEIVNNGHVDGLAVALLLGALLALGADRHRRAWRPLLAGALVGGATLVKLYPVVLLVAVWAAPGMTWRHRARSAAALGGVVTLGYLPHVLAVGVRVIGYLPGYLKEEHYTGKATRFLLVGLLHLPAKATTAVVAAVVVAAVVLVLYRRPPPAVGATTVMGVLLLCATPVQPWYGITLLALATVAARPAWGWVVVAGYPYFFSIILDALHVIGFGQLSYGAGAVLAMATAASWRWRRSAAGSAQPDGSSKSGQRAETRS